MKKPDEIINYINLSYTLRNKEITDFYLLVNQIDQNMVETLEKAFVLLLYAHWEGYIKEVSNEYISYVTTQKIAIKNLTDNFYDIYLKELLKNYTQTTTLKTEFDLRKKVLNINNKFNIDFNDSYYSKYILGIESNLKFKKYVNICNLTNYNFNDSMGLFERVLHKVVHNRNSIAHTGSKAKDDSYINKEDLKDMMEILLKEMNNFKEHIITCIKEKKFLKE